MRHQAVQHTLKCDIGFVPGRQGDTGQQLARGTVVVLVHGHHVAPVVAAVGPSGIAAPTRGATCGIGPAGERIGVFAHHFVVIGGGACTALQTAIDIQLTGSDGEKLQQLAPEIFIGGGLVVVGVVQVVAHDGRQRYFFEDLPVVAKGVLQQGVVVVTHPVGALYFQIADHHNLLQSKSHALTKLVRPVHGVAVEIPEQGLRRKVVTPTLRARVGWQVAKALGFTGDLVDAIAATCGVGRGVQGHLFSDPRIHAFGLDVHQQSLGCTEGGLLGQTHGTALRHRGCGWRRGWGWRWWGQRCWRRRCCWRRRRCWRRARCRRRAGAWCGGWRRHRRRGRRHGHHHGRRRCRRGRWCHDAHRCRSRRGRYGDVGRWCRCRKRRDTCTS